MVIHRIWVVEKAKNQGYGSALENECLHDAYGMNGICVLTAPKDEWLPNNKLFQKNFFQCIDKSPPYFELYAKIFDTYAPLPKISPINQIDSQTNKRSKFIFLHSAPIFHNFLRSVKITQKNSMFFLLPKKKLRAGKLNKMVFIFMARFGRLLTDKDLHRNLKNIQKNDFI